jgi:hypothetical protein
MKTQKTLSSVAIAFAAVLALASCTQSDDILADGPKAVQFTAGIGEQAVATPQTRAAGTEWNKNDAIGVFMVKNKETNIASTYAGNKKFTLFKSNDFWPVSGNEIYYPLEESNLVDFYAYYPYLATDGINIDSKIDVSTADQTKQPEFDMMWAKADNTGSGYNKNFGGNIPLVFAHCLARLTMNCKLDPSTGISGFTDQSTVTIKGMNTATTLAIKDGTLSAATKVADFKARKATPTSGYDGTFDAIIVPAKYGANTVTVEFYVNSETYTWEMEATEFESGNDYVYEVIITRTGIKANGTIIPWITKDQDKVYAE